MGRERYEKKAKKKIPEPKEDDLKNPLILIPSTRQFHEAPRGEHHLRWTVLPQAGLDKGLGLKFLVLKVEVIVPSLPLQGSSGSYKMLPSCLINC